MPCSESKAERARKEREREVCTLAGTLVPSDQILIGREQFRGQAAESTELCSDSQVRAAVNTMSGQPWVWRLCDDTKATLVNSAQHWFTVERHDVAKARMVEAGKAGGSQPPRRGHKPRGRPRRSP